MVVLNFTFKQIKFNLNTLLVINFIKDYTLTSVATPEEHMGSDGFV